MASVWHEKLEEVFSVALAKRPGGDRTTYLSSACADDAELRTQVEGLLGAHDRVGSFLDVPPVDFDATRERGEPPESVGARIGRYKILQEIGEGGFGSVYMAEQQEPVRRKVALKIIKLGMDTKQVIARFEAERQALALMDHANIAAVLDAGATDTGRPYFVMELVKGVAITEYCDKSALTTRERLELFLPICHAVQHAHQKGIIHRDLKPSNVLVTMHDEKPVPKVIDFGIAKATGQRLTEKTLFTGFREFLGTPQYMSPDQADTGGPDVDTRADVYSLGVLVYELLTGTTPLDAEDLRGAPFEEMRRIIRETEPAKPSARLLTITGTHDRAAFTRAHRADGATIARQIRGDLDWIVMKAIEKDRTRRYATAKDLADDIDRHLRHEPVVAGPPSAVYNFSKFVRRHRVGVFVGSITAVALLVGLTVATLGLIEANRARDAAEAARANERVQRTRAEAGADEARQQAAKSATVGGFLQEMLASVDPSRARGREVSVRYILDEAVKRIAEGTLAQQPEVEATVRTTLGETYQALALYAAAEEHLRAAQTIRSRLLGDEHPDTLRSNRALAGLLRVRGRFAEAESLLRRTAETQRRILGDDHPDTLTTMTELALALWGPGRYAEAEAIHRQTLGTQLRVLGEEHGDTIESMGNLGAVCRALGKSAEAETHLRRALDLCMRVLGQEHPCTAEIMNNLGLLLEQQRDLENAENLFRRTYDLTRRILGPDHPNTLIPMNNLLRVLHARNETNAIHPVVAERMDHLRRIAERPGANALAVHAYAWELLHCESGNLQDPRTALPLASRAVEMDGATDATMLETLATAFERTGDLDSAIETQRTALERARAGGPYNRAAIESKLVDYLLSKRDLIGAAGVSWAGLGALLEDSLLIGQIPGASLVTSAEALTEQARYDEAASALRGCLAMRQKALPEGHWLLADTISRLGAAVAGTGAYAEAEALLLDAHAAMEVNHRTPAERKRQAAERLVELYEAWGKPDRASEQRLRINAAAAPSESIPPDAGD